jgi:hypothetical protein
VGARGGCARPRARPAVVVSVPVTIEFTDEALERLAERAAEIVLERLDRDRGSPWLTGARAIAEHLGWPVQRVYNVGHRLPIVRDGHVLMARRDELDEWLVGRGVNRLGFVGGRSGAPQEHAAD